MFKDYITDKAFEIPVDNRYITSDFDDVIDYNVYENVNEETDIKFE